MFAALFHHLPLPRSLRWQFILALAALELLIVAGSVTAIYALRVSAEATRQLAEERLLRLQNAQNLAGRTLLIERETERMLDAESVDEMHRRYDEINNQMEVLDRLVQSLGAASADISVLALQQSAQLFRNTTHVVARLREKQLHAGAASVPGKPDRPAEDGGTMRHFHGELEHQAVAMVASAQELSSHITSDYREAVRQVADTSRRIQRWVLALFVGSLIMTWQVSRFFGRHVLTRLQAVSNSLRRGECASDRRRVSVQGRDEIGEMARAVEQFLEDRQRLAEANEELEAFSYSVSHDLRAPLRAIDGFSQILIEFHPSQLDKEGRQYLDNIHNSAVRMRDLINDILDFSRMSRREMTMEPVDMAGLAQEVFEEVRSAMPERNIVLRLDDLPPAKGDPALIRQVLINLLSNSVKFTAAQAEAVIEMSCVEAGEQNTYRVKDNGVGFDMQHAGKLFGVFQRLHKAEQFEGTGIGLAIVKRIVVRHGGRVWAESKPGEGAIMYFTLPRA
jgi:two-component system, NtrC family, sensor kinase